MARHFNFPAGDKITVSLGGTGIVPPITLLGVAQKVSNSIGGAGGATLFQAGVASLNDWNLHTTNTGALSAWWGSGSSQGAPTAALAPTDGWCLVGCSKAAGTTATRFYKYTYETGLWILENSASTVADPAAPITNSFIGVNQTADFWDGDIAVIGVWHTVLSDADVQKLAADISVSFWTNTPATPPVALWRLNQPIGTSLQDSTGNGANQSSISGTLFSIDPGISVARWPDYSKFPPRFP